eukprot:1008653-Pleurochrysis_carterae.AAC.2
MNTLAVGGREVGLKLELDAARVGHKADDHLLDVRLEEERLGHVCAAEAEALELRAHPHGDGQQLARAVRAEAAAFLPAEVAQHLVADTALQRLLAHSRAARVGAVDRAIATASRVVVGALPVCSASGVCASMRAAAARRLILMQLLLHVAIRRDSAHKGDERPGDVAVGIALIGRIRLRQSHPEPARPTCSTHSHLQPHRRSMLQQQLAHIRRSEVACIHAVPEFSFVCLRQRTAIHPFPCRK